MKKIIMLFMCLVFLFGCVERRQNTDPEPTPIEPVQPEESVVVNPMVLEQTVVEDGETGDICTIQYTYNENGMCTSEISRYENGRVQSVHIYDYKDGTLFSDDCDGIITYYEYNEKGQCITERYVGMYGETETKKEYDEKGFLQKETTMSSGGVMYDTEYTFVSDDAGRIRTKIIKEQGGQTIYRYEYVEKDGLVVQKSNECYTITGKDDEETLLFTGITNYSYEGEDVIKEVTIDTYLGCTTQITKTYVHLQDLKPDSNPYVKVKDVCRDNDNEWERIYKYDSDGLLESMTEQDITTVYTYENGLLVMEQNPNQTIRYQYDMFNRKIQEDLTNTQGTFTRVYSYNEYGDPVFTSLWDNNNPDVLLEEFTYEYHYDGDELVSMDTMVNEMVLYTIYYTYRYDSLGRMITRTAEEWDPIQEEILSTTYYEYAYDIHNQLIDYYELIENGYRIVELHSVYERK